MIGIAKRILLVAGVIPASVVGFVTVLLLSLVILCALVMAGIEWLLRGRSRIYEWTDVDRLSSTRLHNQSRIDAVDDLGAIWLIPVKWWIALLTTR